MKLKRETKIGLASLIAAIISIIAIVMIILGTVTEEKEKMWLLVILCLSLMMCCYCLLVDWHKPDPHWKVKLAGVFSCCTEGLLLAGIRKNISINAIMETLFFSIFIFALYYAFLYVVEKIDNFKMKLLKERTV